MYLEEDDYRSGDTCIQAHAMSIEEIAHRDCILSTFGYKGSLRFGPELQDAQALES